MKANTIVYFWQDRLFYATTETNRGMRYHENVPCRILSLGLKGPIKIHIQQNGVDQVVYTQSVFHDINSSWGEEFSGDVVCNLLIDPASAFNDILEQEMTKNNYGLSVTLRNEKQVLDCFRQIYEQGFSQTQVNDVIHDCFGSPLGNVWYKPQLDKRIVSVVEQLQVNSAKRPKTVKIANEVGLSESRLSHLFKKNLGISITQYIIWRRFFYICQIALKEKNLLRAAIAVGFWDGAHMSNTFRKLVGVSASQLLKNAIKSKFKLSISEK